MPLMQGPAGMPLGAQLVGARGDDGRLFRTAKWLLNQLDGEQTEIDVSEPVTGDGQSELQIS